jgi:hypothetical protein
MTVANGADGFDSYYSFTGTTSALKPLACAERHRRVLRLLHWTSKSRTAIQYPSSHNWQERDRNPWEYLLPISRTSVDVVRL